MFVVEEALDEVEVVDLVDAEVGVELLLVQVGDVDELDALGPQQE